MEPLLFNRKGNIHLGQEQSRLCELGCRGRMSKFSVVGFAPKHDVGAISITYATFLSLLKN